MTELTPSGSFTLPSNKTKSKESSLTILTNTNNSNTEFKSLSKNLNENENENYGKQISSSRSYMTSFDDLIDYRRTLLSCYSSRAITMYNVSTNLKDYSGSTPSMFSLNKTVTTQKISRSCSGEKSLLGNISSSSQTILTNSTSLPKIKSFKDKLFVFRKSKSIQQWLDEFLRRNINDEKLDTNINIILDSNTNLTSIFNITDYNSHYDLLNLYNSLMKAGDNYLYTLEHEPFWKKQPKIFPESDVQDIRSLSKELHIFKDDLNMPMEGIKYKVIDGKSIPYEGTLDAVLDCLIFPTSQEEQFTDAFLEVYKFYITSFDLLKFIISWFNVKLPKNYTKEQELFYDENRKNIQQRCLKLLNFWIRLHWHDFTSSVVMSLLNKFMNQIGDSINNTNLYAEYTKLDTVLRRQKLAIFTRQYTLISESNSTIMKSKFTVPNDTKKPWALIMSSQEFSSQLLLHEQSLFKEIEPDFYIYLLEGIKLVDENYGKFTLYKPARIFFNYISWFHQISLYTITVIAEQQSVRKKHFALKKFIKIAKLCLNYKNYNSAAAIYYSLKNQLIVRHHALWESLPSELIENIEELDNALCSSYNYHNELQQLESKPSSNESVIPFLFEHVRQLVEQIKFEDKITFDFNLNDNLEKENKNENNNPDKKDSNLSNNENITNNNNSNNNDNDSNSNNNNNSNNSNDDINKNDNNKKEDIIHENSENSDEKKLNILNWLSINQIIMEIEGWRLNAKNQSLNSPKSNTSNNIIGDKITAEQTANHIFNYPKWDNKKIIEQTLPYSLSLKRCSKKSTYSKCNSLKEIVSPSPLFYSMNELSPSPLSAPPLQSQPNENDIISPIMAPLIPDSSSQIAVSPNTPYTPNTPCTPNTAI